MIPSAAPYSASRPLNSLKQKKARLVRAFLCLRFLFLPIYSCRAMCIMSEFACALCQANLVDLYDFSLSP